MLIPVGKVLVPVPDACACCASTPAPEWMAWFAIGLVVLCLLMVLGLVVGVLADVAGWFIR